MNNTEYNSFKKAYRKIIDSEGSFEATLDGTKYSENVEKAIFKACEEINKIGNPNKGVHYIKGDISEPWHSETFNINAVAKGKENLSFSVPRDTSPIDVIGNNSLDFLKAQLKYFKTPEDTAKAISHPKYEGLIKLVPSDQLDEVKKAAYNLYLKNLEKRPEQAEHYLNTYKVATDRLSHDNIESNPLTEQESLKIAKEIQKNKFEGKDHGLSSENFVEWSDVFRESSQAALNAALISIVLKCSPKLFEILKEALLENNIDSNKLKQLGSDAISGGIEGAFRGGIAATLTIACKSGLINESLKNINPNVIGAAVVIATNAIKNSFKVFNGEMTKEEFAETCLKDTFVISCGFLGASIGQTLIPIPILGALIGNLVGSICAVIIYEGTKSLFFSFFINTGFSFFCIVKQDYTLPREILEKCGFDLINIDKPEIDTIELDTISLDTITVDTFDIKILKRGLININTIGFV